ncbi:hypothetical protein ACSTK1_16765 [Vibrio parahaemolyticus]|uniref:hypothetical protein n=1 Tax=Vibrio harveyi group TaxID=717610 RepID=UPI000997D7EF|nr:hypothetical protein [Vibrio parahaemolyticus]EIV8502202.1 hypothetical protein [Vibrio parahaemolyticus]MBE4332191.1 hypothetical protein [Vibrio parahaemolyticus]MDF4912226.1 hypothetical protein [Vibrio parahaemolyticus]OOX38837.1 hypothetical protein BJL76_22500 [Vibrio parahaemolyticus]OOX57968.1 hypothetical protein BJL79_15445 [Vibrio parahaemolyticus]
MIEFGVFVVILIVVAVPLFFVMWRKTYDATLYAGCLLMSLGLIASSFSILYVDFFIDLDPDVNSFRKHLLSNMFLIVAAIGANLFATAVCSKVKQRDNFINDKVKFEIEVTKMK